MTEKQKCNISNSIKGLIDSGNADKEPVHLYAPNIEVVDLWDHYKGTFDKYVVDAIEARQTSQTAYEYNRDLGNEELSDLISLCKKLGIESTFKEKFNSFFKKLNIPMDNNYVLLNFFNPNSFQGLLNTCGFRREVTLVKYLGARVKDRLKIDDEVKKLYKYIKEYVDAGYIMGNLKPLIFIPFANINTGLPDGGAVMSYLIFTPEGIEYLEKTKPEVEVYEGGVPKELED